MMSSRSHAVVRRTSASFCSRREFHVAAAAVSVRQMPAKQFTDCVDSLASSQQTVSKSARNVVLCKNTWAEIATRLNELSPTLSPAQIVKVCDLVLKNKKDVLTSPTPSMTELREKLMSNLKGITDNELSIVFATLYNAGLIDASTLIAISDEVSARLPSIKVKPLVDIAATFAHLKATSEKKKDERMQEKFKTDLFFRMATQLVQRMPEIVNADLTCSAVHASASLHGFDMEKRGFLKKQLVENVENFEIDELKLFPSAMVAIGSQDPSLYKKGLDGMFVRIESCSGVDLYTFLRRSSRLTFEPEDDNGTVKTGAVFFSEKVLNDFGGLSMPSVATVATCLALASAHHTRANSDAIKSTCEAFAYKVSSKVPKLLNNTDVSSKAPLTRQQLSHLMMHLSEMLLPENHKAIATFCDGIKRSLTLSESAWGKCDADAMTAIALAAARFSKTGGLGGQEIADEMLLMVINKLSEKVGLATLGAEETSRLVEAIAVMGKSGSKVIDAYCSVVNNRLALDGSVAAQLPTASTVLSLAHQVLRTHGMSREMCTLLTRSVLVVSEALQTPAGPKPAPGLLVNAVAAVSSLLAELPYGSPLRAQVVGALAPIARRLGKGASLVSTKFITEALLDALPHDASEFRAALMREGMGSANKNRNQESHKGSGKRK